MSAVVVVKKVEVQIQRNRNTCKYWCHRGWLYVKIYFNLKTLVIFLLLYLLLLLLLLLPCSPSVMLTTVYSWPEYYWQADVSDWLQPVLETTAGKNNMAGHGVFGEQTETNSHVCWEYPSVKGLSGLDVHAQQRPARVHMQGRNERPLLTHTFQKETLIISFDLVINID